MIRHLPRRATGVWLALVVVTCATFWLGTNHPFADVGARVSSAIAITLAFVKVYFIGQDFMEIRNAPTALRAIFATWVLLVCGFALLIYAT